MASWKSIIFNGKNLLNPGTFSIAMFVYQRVNTKKNLKKWGLGRW